jgi:hypothetical protein
MKFIKMATKESGHKRRESVTGEAKDVRGLQNQGVSVGERVNE